MLVFLSVSSPLMSDVTARWLEQGLSNDKLQAISKTIKEDQRYDFIRSWLEILQYHDGVYCGDVYYKDIFLKNVSAMEVEDIIASGDYYRVLNAKDHLHSFLSKVRSTEFENTSSQEDYRMSVSSLGELQNAQSEMLSRLSLKQYDEFMDVIKNINLLIQPSDDMAVGGRKELLDKMPDITLEIWDGRSFEELLKIGEIAKSEVLSLKCIESMKFDILMHFTSETKRFGSEVSKPVDVKNRKSIDEFFDN